MREQFGEVGRAARRHALELLEVVPEGQLKGEAERRLEHAQLLRDVRVVRIVHGLLRAALEQHTHDFALLLAAQIQLLQLFKAVHEVGGAHHDEKDGAPNVSVHSHLLGERLELDATKVALVVVVIGGGSSGRRGQRGRRGGGSGSRSGRSVARPGRADQPPTT